MTKPVYQPRTDDGSALADEQRLVALFRLMPEVDRDELLALLSMRTLISLSKAAPLEVSPVMQPSGEDEEDPIAFTREFLWDIKPPQEPRDYLGDFLGQALEYAWPNGIEDAILGSATLDQFNAADLLAGVEQHAEDAGNSEPPWFGKMEMAAFIQAWRSNFMSALQSMAQSSNSVIER